MFFAQIIQKGGEIRAIMPQEIDCRLGPQFSLWVTPRWCRGSGTISSEKDDRERKLLHRIFPLSYKFPLRPPVRRARKV